MILKLVRFVSVDSKLDCW